MVVSDIHFHLCFIATGAVQVQLTFSLLNEGLQRIAIKVESVFKVRGRAFLFTIATIMYGQKDFSNDSRWSSFHMADVFLHSYFSMARGQCFILVY